MGNVGKYTIHGCYGYGSLAKLYVTKPFPPSSHPKKGRLKCVKESGPQKWPNNSFRLRI